MNEVSISLHVSSYSAVLELLFAYLPPPPHLCFLFNKIGESSVLFCFSRTNSFPRGNLKVPGWHWSSRRCREVKNHGLSTSGTQVRAAFTGSFYVIFTQTPLNTTFQVISDDIHLLWKLISRHARRLGTSYAITKLCYIKWADLDSRIKNLRFWVVINLATFASHIKTWKNKWSRWLLACQ